jgi:protein tyrosine/serine phosphatase
MADNIIHPSSEADVPTTLIDLAEISSIRITEAIPQDILAASLATPPFVPVEGSLNLRDIGLLPNSPIKPGILFRSGSLHTIPDPSIAKLHLDLGITTIFDLRHEQERTQWSEPTIEGVQSVWLKSTTPPAPLNPASFEAEGGIPGFVNMYRGLLKLYAPQYRIILEHLRDHPADPILWHCTAGKDRAGLFAILILSLAGAGREVIGYDYALTRIGIEREREVLQANLVKWLGEDAMVSDVAVFDYALD